MGRGRVVWMMENNDWSKTWVDMNDLTITSALEDAYQNDKKESWQITKDTKYKIHFDLVKMQQFSYCAITMKFHFARPIRRTFVYSCQEVKNAVCDNSIMRLYPSTGDHPLSSDMSD